MILENLMLSVGAEQKSYTHEQEIFSENEVPIYFYYIKSGKVKLNNYIENGKEFIHNILDQGEIFAECYLFSEKNYSYNAVAIHEVTVLRQRKSVLKDFLIKNPEMYPEILRSIAKKSYCQDVMMQNIALQNPEKKLKIFFDYLKENQGEKEKFCMQILLTRQQIASITGLSVETVIRTIKNMEKNGILKIQNRKIFY